MLAEFCAEFKLPFDLMIGVNRAVYRDGVYQGQDLYDSRVSLIQYKETVQRVPSSHVPNLRARQRDEPRAGELRVDLSERRHQRALVVLEHAGVHRARRDRAARSSTANQKQAGYYTDAYKLEFCLPKFAMYKRILAKILAEAVRRRTRLERKQAVGLGRRVLRGNVEQIFRWPSRPNVGV